MHETHRYCVYENGAHLVYEISANALDVPFGNRFSVETRIDVTTEQVGHSRRSTLFFVLIIYYTLTETCLSNIRVPAEPRKVKSCTLTLHVRCSSHGQGGRCSL